MFPPTRPKLATFQPTKPKEKVLDCVWCKQASYVSTEPNQSRYDSTDSREQNVLGSVRRNSVMFRPTPLKENCVWLCATKVCYISTNSTKRKKCSILLNVTVLCFGRIDREKNVFKCVRTKRAMFRPIRPKEKCVPLRLTQGVLCFDQLDQS